MATNKDPNTPKYQCWWESKFEKDFTVIQMNWIQEHLYRRLLQKAFVCDTAPYLPADDHILWHLAGAQSYEMWMQERPIIMTKFEPFTDEHDRALLRHKRLEEDYNRINDEVSEKRREAGRRGAEARWSKNGKPDAIMANDAEPSWQNGKTCLNRNININQNRNNTHPPTGSADAEADEVFGKFAVEEVE